MQELTHLPPQWTKSHDSICIFKSCLEPVQLEKSMRASAKQQVVIWSCKRQRKYCHFLDVHYRAYVFLRSSQRTVTTTELTG